MAIAIFFGLLARLPVSKILSDGDTYWHTAAGRWIAEHGTVPRSAPFSHSMPGAPWTAHEWLPSRPTALAWQGVTSFSAAPLGLLVSGASFAGALWVPWARLVGGHTLPGWASIRLSVFFLGGVQLLSLGVIGEYDAKIYVETKRRLRYVVERST